MTSHAIQKRKYRPGLYVANKFEKESIAKTQLNPEFGALTKEQNHVKLDRSLLPKIGLIKLRGGEGLTAIKPQESLHPGDKKLTQKVKKGVKSALLLVTHTFRIKCSPSQDYYEEQKLPRSSYGVSGFALSLVAIAFLIAAFLIQAYWGILLVIPALILALFSLIRSIKGLKDSYKFNRKGKFFSFFGLFASATALVISAFVAFILLLAIIAFILV
jgi:hypothetical protein